MKDCSLLLVLQLVFGVLIFGYSDQPEDEVKRDTAENKSDRK